MKLIIFSVFLGWFLVSGLGSYFLHKIQANENNYSAPVGLALFFALMQIGYYPCQIMHGSFRWIMAVTVLVLLFSLYCLIREWKNVLHQLVQRKTLIVLAGAAAFLVIFYLCYLDLEYSDSPMYLNYISQNIDIDHLNLFHLYTGVTGAEWDGLYLYQGYYHFVSAFVSLLNVPSSFGIGAPVETLKASVWGMGLLYSLCSNCLLVNILDALPVKKSWQKIALAVFALFYLNLYYWRVVFGFYGNTFRSFFITLAMTVIYQKEAGTLSLRASRRILIAIGFAGLACSSSYLFISFALLSVYAAYRFLNGEKGCLYDMSLLIIPLAVYACVMISRGSVAGLLLTAFFVIYYAAVKTVFVQTVLNAIETVLIRYAKILFIGVIPAVCAAFALYIHVKYPEFLYGYAYYFNNHQTYDMVKDYFFVYSTWYDNIINVLRWAGLIVFCIQAKTPQHRYLRTSALLTLLVFMNPLCTPTVSYFIASNVFYRAWEVLFNPFTELLFIGGLLVYFENTKPIPLFVCGCLVGVTLVSNGLALRGDRNAAYGFYIASVDENYSRIQKMDRYGEEAILALKQALEEDPITDRQPVVLSQAEGTRIYLPSLVQLVTARDTYYASTRVNDELYRIAKRHHPWEDDGDVPYEHTCSLLKQYDVDYVLVRYWENPEFDEAASACSVDIYQNSYFRLKKVN